MNFADPLITELNILQEMVKPKSTITRIADVISVSGQGASRSKVRFQWKNPDSLLRDPDFLIEKC